VWSLLLLLLLLLLDRLAIRLERLHFDGRP